MPSQNITELKYLLALSFINDIGPITISRLISEFNSGEAIFEAGLSELTSAAAISPSKAKKIKEFNGWSKVEAELERAEKSGIRIMTLFDKDYPESLRQLDNAPVILYVRGTLLEEDRFALAMVGSRLMSDYGRKIAGEMAHELASSGLTIVSGLARGIDTVSHSGALKAGGRSIAVLGCGADICYPPENKELMIALSSSGCVISEFPLGIRPLKENFPRRNRLISGLSLGVLVVEATARSGSLITVRFALEQGKEVFAVPGNITSDRSDGTNGLIKQGAKPVQSAADVLEELSAQIKGHMAAVKTVSSARHAHDRLEINDEEKAICNILGEGPRHIDHLLRELRIPPARISGLLLGLEMKGIVGQTEGNNFYII
ncbi:MAG: DNA-protecting protein DprA [Nitrospirae bacterium]|nr:DNA-protecting protein DprA [Nitrospirota bacterium]